MTRLPNRTKGASLSVGVDVAKATLEVGWSDRDATLAPANNEAGHKALLAHLAAVRTEGESIGLVVLEATGGFEVAVATALRSDCAACAAQARSYVAARPRAWPTIGAVV